ncbi:hypothetical protein ACFFF7_05285 [Novosphingobium aquiterrae]|uniref:DUF202 domain-containing protein n=1 Tax=Novosphingobium aquiterrae TaxID=624388 RepID=A0ABV6PG76_9SPHN
MDRNEALKALDTVHDARVQLARAMDCPPWRHAAFGAVMAALVAANAVPRAWFVPLFVLSMAATVWLVRSDRRRTGTFVNGWRLGRTLPLSGGLFVVLLALIFMARRGQGTAFLTPAGLIAVGLSFVIGTGVSVLWQRVYLAELRAGGAA